MSDATFLDNQEVTAQDLNDIAIDLGYPDYSHFTEQTPPSAVSALNQITADLVSPGVLLSGNRCAVTYSDGIVYVDTGIIVFESGAKKRIGAMQQLQAHDGTNCIYALNDTINNTILLKCSEAFPTEGDFVKLGTVTDGVVGNDMKAYCMAKVALPSKPNYKIIDGYFLGYYENTGGNSYILEPFDVMSPKEWEYEIDFDTSFTHMIFEYWHTNMVIGSFRTSHVDFSASDDYIAMNVSNVYVKKIGNKLLFKCTGTNYGYNLVIRNVYFF